MSLVHSDCASSSGSSGLCRCLLWDNICGNLYVGLLLSVAADAYHFDLRKLIKGPALPACCCSVFCLPPALRDLSSTEFTTAREWWTLSSLLFDTSKQRGYLKNSGLSALSSGLHISWEFSLWGLWPENKASVWTMICLSLGSSWISAFSALDVDSYHHFCGPRDSLVLDTGETLFFLLP